MSEYYILFSIFGLASLIQGEVILDDPPCLDEKNYGKDMFCLFGYASWCAPKYFLKDSLTVRYFGVAQLPNHRFDFATPPGDLKVMPTVVPDNEESTWGSTYLLHVNYFNKLRELSKKIYGKKVDRLVAKDVLVLNNNGRLVHHRCNVVVAVDQPKKELIIPEERRPPGQYMDMLIECFYDMGLPQVFIDNIATYPTQEPYS